MKATRKRAAHSQSQFFALLNFALFPIDK